MSKNRHLPIIVGLLMMAASAAGAQKGQVQTARPGEQAERQLSSDQKFSEWAIKKPELQPAPEDFNPDIKRIKVCRVDTLCKMRFIEGQTPRTRVKNLVAPLRYESETIALSEAFTRQVKQAFSSLQDRPGVKVRFIGYTDDAQLTGRDETTYGDNLSYSKAQAQRVAQAMQETLGLSPSEIESDGRGATRPLASNTTTQGRMLNRRVEVEFWYDDPLQELPEEPQVCPGDAQEMATRVYDPSWGSISILQLENGQPIIPPDYASNLKRALTDVADKTNARLRFIGYTKNERLDRRTASVYGDDIGLSAARARRALDILMKDPVLSGAKAEHEGRGYVQSNDVVNEGFIQGQDSFVRVQVVYDEPLPLDNYEGIDITRLNHELRPKSPYELNVMHITVDGKPIDDPGRSSEDIQRCTDVALDKADIQFRFDNLESKPRLAVAAHPVAVGMSPKETDPAAVVRFKMYANYKSFFERGEIRIFDLPQSLEAPPYTILPLDDVGYAEWQPTPQTLTGAERELKFLLRVYDSKGNFDETAAHPLRLYREMTPAKIITVNDPMPQELLAAYGESDLVHHGIPLGSGTIKVQGSGIPSGHSVWLAGRQVPVDPQGKFVAEEILPDGTHTVEVGVLDVSGNGSLYLRDLELKRKDLFYVGAADITLSANHASGPVSLLQGGDVTQPYDSPLDGRLAFYVNGKISQKWRLTTSADTREGPVKHLFSNFLDKSPDALMRRIDPDYFYPTFGDDTVVTEMAPTLGKFYLKANRGQSYGMWGNFKVGYLGNELAHVDRGLYGANSHFVSGATTKFGEGRIALDGFAAQPGTMSSFEEFRGTGGSVYFMRHTDLLTGSERVRIEMRDKDSGIVTGVVNLKPSIDYDIDYLQGRLLLSEPLSSTADDNLLVRNTGLSGNQAFLVARYEYTPTFDKLDAVAVGGQSRFWVNDHLGFGLTANHNKEGDTNNSNLGAADMTFRVSTNSFFKVQAGRSDGLVSRSQISDDGGFGFRGPDDSSFASGKAGAYRADVSFWLGDFLKGHDGRFSFYKQSLDAGYSAPGQATIKDTAQYGGTFKVPVTRRLSLAGKGDQKVEDFGLETRAVEMDIAYKLAERWNLSTGVRNDYRKDRSPIVALTQEQGERTDAVTQLTFDNGAIWKAYGFAQSTLATTGGRPNNGRVGVGGSYRLSKRLRIDGEGSDGDLGRGGKIGTSFLYSERTSLYLNYVLENERTDNGSQVRRGNLISGAKSRLTDSSSVYLEERYQDGSMTGLTHATGINLVAKERWNFGANSEIGTLRDTLTAAGTDRKAAGLRMGYGLDKMQFSSAVEYRRDDAQQPDLTHTLRNAWLFRNNFKLQLTPDWRMLGKLDHSLSTSSLGEFYGGGYTEAVVGYAYRPVKNDRLSALSKYTYMYNVPTLDQVVLSSNSVEFIQKSHVASVDMTYDVTKNWSVGGKYAYRQGQASVNRQVPEFFDNAAQLGVLRLDRKIGKNWETMAEARMLDLMAFSQRRRGGLATVYRYLGQNLKVGVGYNFTDFSDDLTDLKYNHRGVFVNIIGTK